MKEIIGYIKTYWREINKQLLLLCTLQTALLIYLNYAHGLERKMISTFPFAGYYLVFFVAFSLPYLYFLLITKTSNWLNKQFLFLLVIAPAIFSLKVIMNTNLFSQGDPAWNQYWNQVVYWPVRVVTITAFLFALWKYFTPQNSFYGLTVKNFNWKPYVMMLLIMLPLIAAASTQPDFQMMYPRLKTTLDVSGHLHWYHKLLFELSYGTDFFSIELFFRGFLILAFIQWVGKDAILPMACFYCTIHFGKPLGECISSYFGGLILGIVVYNTRSIWGGLIVHLGIAWLMELGGYLGNSFY